MMDWTDRHCRYFLRQCAPHARLYTEMITTGALLHGDAGRHLAFDAAEHPLAAQLGGSEPDELAACARMVEAAGYDEVNLNIGCPSERVQRGAFGACLMAEPELVADCVRAMREAVSIPVTVKHRIGIDKVESYDFVAKFVSIVASGGCTTFIVHARNAVLTGLSRKETREIPPLRYEAVHRLKRDFPGLEFVVNGGLTDWAAIEAQLAAVDGVDGVVLERVHELLRPHRVRGGDHAAPREPPGALPEDDLVAFLPEVLDALAEAERFREARRADDRDRGAALEAGRLLSLHRARERGRRDNVTAPAPPATTRSGDADPRVPGPPPRGRRRRPGGEDGGRGNSHGDRPPPP